MHSSLNFDGSQNHCHSPEDALKRFKTKLTEFEKSEIHKFDRIYFIGSEAEKKGGKREAGNDNHGYDDKDGIYKIALRDHIGYRFEVLGRLGSGSFGQVVQAYDHKLHINVALKIVGNTRYFHRQVANEIKILNHLRKKDYDNSNNIIKMFEHLTFRNHKCIIFECASISLYGFMKANQFRGSDITLVKKIGHSLLNTLDLLHKNKIIHCDLKPENIVLRTRNRCSIKVIDFGCSCFENEILHDYIGTRFYRAPEIILGIKYGMPMDMWAFGCILAELLTGKPLFPDGLPKYCTQTVLKDGRIVLGNGQSKKGKIRGIPGSRSWETTIKYETDDPFDKLFIDFLKSCLTWDPDQRLTPENALNHYWLQRGKSFNYARRD